MTPDQNSGNLLADLFFSEAEQERLISKIWELLKTQANRYNGGDSTSMTVERAQDLLESLLYTIGAAMEEGVSKQEVLDGDLRLLIDKGQEILREKKASAKIDWELMCRDLPGAQNVYFADTVRNIGLFFKQYDVCYGAHQIPCSIDYWLLCPISETRKGVSYIEEYLHRLQIENDFLSCFARERILRLYSRCIPDYPEAFFNLCDPVLINAVGRAMLGQAVQDLNVSATGRNEILALLRGKPKEELQAQIEASADSVCRQLGMTDAEEKDYFIQAARGLSARLYEAVRNGDLSHVFVSFSQIEAGNR